MSGNSRIDPKAFSVSRRTSSGGRHESNLRFQAFGGLGLQRFNRLSRQEPSLGDSRLKSLSISVSRYDGFCSAFEAF